MKTALLGRTGLEVSRLSFGASSLGGVFHPVNEAECVQAVHAALELGINYFDVSPAYGATRAEEILGRALKGIPQDRYVLSTKVGKQTSPAGENSFDYSEDGIRRSLDESQRRLGVDYVDMVFLHDIEYCNGMHTEWALEEGLCTLRALKDEGQIGYYGIGMYPVALWERVIREGLLDVGLVHNHYCLNDNRLLELLPLAQETGLGLINASPFASGLLTNRGPADWHPATSEQRAIFAKAAATCAGRGEDISRLALQYSCQHPEISSTMFSTANPDTVRQNIAWSEEPYDAELLSAVQKVLAPVMNIDWNYC